MTATTTSTTTVLVTTTSPVPSAFRLGFRSLTDTQVILTPYFERAEFNSTLMQPGLQSQPGDIFFLGSDNSLTLSRPQGTAPPLDLTAERNARNPFPYLFLEREVNRLHAPQCKSCNGTLSCDYTGTRGNRFALCNGLLALGDPQTFLIERDSRYPSPCEVVELDIVAA